MGGKEIGVIRWGNKLLGEMLRGFVSCLVAIARIQVAERGCDGGGGPVSAVRRGVTASTIPAQ
jgi:hypothetical protein